MKKIFIYISAIVLLSAFSTSCNKKLKENMDELETSLNEQKSKNETLQNQVNTLNSIVVKTPMTVNFSTTDNNNETVAFSGDYSFAYGSDYGYSFIMDLLDGTYYVYIWRGADLETDYYSTLSFIYNPTTGAKTSIYAEVYGYGSKGQQIYDAEFNGTTEITNALTVSAFDFNAGTISFNYTGTTTAAYGNNYYSGKPMSLTLSYSGSMAKYYEPMF
jgi:hypothetical protein